MTTYARSSGVSGGSASAAEAAREFYARQFATAERDFEDARQDAHAARAKLEANRQAAMGPLQTLSERVADLWAVSDAKLFPKLLVATLLPYNVSLAVAATVGMAMRVWQPSLATETELALASMAVLIGAHRVILMRRNADAGTSDAAVARSLFPAALVTSGILWFLGWFALGIIALFAAAATDVYRFRKGYKDAIRTYRAGRKLPVHRLLVERLVIPGDPVIDGGTPHATSLDRDEGFSGPAFDRWPRYGGQQIDEGDLLVHVGEEASVPAVAFAHGKGFHHVVEREGSEVLHLLVADWQQRVAVSTHGEIENVVATTPAATDALRSLRYATTRSRIAKDYKAALEKDVEHWEHLFLPRDLTHQLLGTLQLVRNRDPAAPPGLLLSGPPGTGKSEIGRRIAGALGGQFISAVTSDFKQSNVGGTEQAVRQFWAKVREKASRGAVVVFLDECDSMFPDRSDSRADQFAKAITEGFLAEWTSVHGGGVVGERGNQVFVMGATNFKARIDLAILRRFGEILEIPLPNAEARSGILSSAFAEFDVRLALTDRLIEHTAGLSGSDLRTIARNAKRDAVIEAIEPKELHVLAAADALRRRSGSSVSPNVTWKSLVIPEETRSSLETIVYLLRHAEAVRKRGMSVPRSLLLTGAPGTGKTQIARVLANEAGITFRAYSTAQMKGTVLGETAERVRKAFADARAAAPAIVYLDEIDVLARTRGAGMRDQYTDEFVGQILQELDGVVHSDAAVFLIASTNCQEQIDPAVHSRFEDTIEIPLPDLKAREAILTMLLSGKPVGAELLAAMEALAKASHGLSGRDLKNAVTLAERATARRLVQSPREDALITLEDVSLALQRSRPRTGDAPSS